MKEVIDHWVKTHDLPDEEALLWRSAADTWRMPYWDWARQQSYTEDFAYPQVLVQGPVRIFVPDALKGFYPPSGLYANPFWGFENPEKDDEGNPLPFGKMPPTKRDWNIEDDPVKHDPAPPQDPKDENQWIPVRIATSLVVDTYSNAFSGVSPPEPAGTASLCPRRASDSAASRASTTRGRPTTTSRP